MLRESPGSGDALYERREEVDGEACAVLLISLRATIEGAEVEPAALGMQGGSDTSALVSLEASCEDRVWFALEQGRPVRFEAQLPASKRASVKTERAAREVVRDFAMTLSGGYLGTWSYGGR